MPQLKNSSLFFAFTLILFACVPEQKQADKKMLIMRSGADISTLNPVFSKGDLANIIGMQVFQPLINFDLKTNELVGILAKAPANIETDTEGNMHIQYELREEAHFDDGSPVLAEDVLFSLKLNICPTYKNNDYMYGFIQGFETDSLNPRKFTYHCSGNSMYYPLFSGGFTILPRKIYDPEELLLSFQLEELLKDTSLRHDSSLLRFAAQFQGDHLAFDPASIQGTGPYRIEALEKGQYIRLKRKDNWWADGLEANLFFNATVPEIRYEIITDAVTAVTALKSGQIDLMHHVPAKDFVALETTEQEDIITQTIDIYGYQFIGFNTNDLILSEPEVRKAIAFSIPREKIIEVVFHGMASPTYGPISPIEKEFQAERLKAISYDLEKARTLLEESKWIDYDQDGIREKVMEGDTLSLSLNYHYNAGSEERKAVGLILKEQLKELGIELSVNALEWTVYLESLKSDEFDLFYSGKVTMPNIPNYTSLFQSAYANGGNNYANYQSEEVDSLIKLIRAGNASNKQELMDAFIDKIQADLPYYFLLTPKENIAYSQHLKNVSIYSLRPNYWAPEFVWE